MSENHLFLRKKILKYILLFFLCILSFNLFIRIIHAQSLLSDPELLGQKIFYSKNISNYQNNTPQSPSDLFFIPEKKIHTLSKQNAENKFKSSTELQNINESFFNYRINSF